MGCPFFIFISYEHSAFLLCKHGFYFAERLKHCAPSKIHRKSCRGGNLPPLTSVFFRTTGNKLFYPTAQVQAANSRPYGIVRLTTSP